jgi:hypothetical protein
MYQYFIRLLNLDIDNLKAKIDTNNRIKIVIILPINHIKMSAWLETPCKFVFNPLNHTSLDFSSSPIYLLILLYRINKVELDIDGDDPNEVLFFYSKKAF